MASGTALRKIGDPKRLKLEDESSLRPGRKELKREKCVRATELQGKNSHFEGFTSRPRSLTPVGVRSPPGRHHQAPPPAHIKDGASRAVIISRLTLNEVYHNTLPVTMSLWRPYSDDVPMDLTKPQVQGVEFSAHHPPQCSECYPPQCSECYPPQLPVSPERLPHGGYYAPLHISPGSSTSGYDAAPKRRLAPEPSIEAPDTLSDDLDFQDFEESALSAMAARNGGALLCSNPRMRRCVRASSADVAADDAFRIPIGEIAAHSNCLVNRMNGDGGSRPELYLRGQSVGGLCDCTNDDCRLIF
ncbi:hypothetical protein PYW08_011489 [Mythimna loreyi]|uniref:Uncharacterized protein n=1 Tax=Mythimna loreyi TaxID=667449 RepID=A0ACC2QJI7_9NEOP|nr:hypothetical protein PYW08_011489 [Mythimna loreyi]